MVDSGWWVVGGRWLVVGGWWWLVLLALSLAVVDLATFINTAVTFLFLKGFAKLFQSVKIVSFRIVSGHKTYFSRPENPSTTAYRAMTLYSKQ